MSNILVMTIKAKCKYTINLIWEKHTRIITSKGKYKGEKMPNLEYYLAFTKPTLKKTKVYEIERDPK